jgi:hypothetical protein
VRLATLLSVTENGSRLVGDPGGLSKYVALSVPEPM